jgi:hypothetical protein
MNDLIKQDIEEKLNLKFDEQDINYFTEGATDSVVLSINDKYLIKTVDENTLKVQEEFLNEYKSDFFQKIIYVNKELLYICYEFIEGEKFNKSKVSVDKLIKDLYTITSNYSLYDYDGYGYLFSDYGKTWRQFLEDEVIYSKQEIEDINIDKVMKALDIIQKYPVKQYLIHGDFGTHNFLFNNDELKVIDPMGVVGDYLYDFYFSILSNSKIFLNVDINKVLEFFNRDIEYKRALFLVVLYIRMSRAHHYDIDNFEKYLKLYNSFN